MFKDFIKTHSGETEISSESPLSKRIERAKINRDLKAPSIDHLDGSTDPADFIHLFDSRMFSTDTQTWKSASIFQRAWKVQLLCRTIISQQGQ